MKLFAKDMEDPNQSAVSEALCGLLTRHGLDCVREQEWIVPNGQLPAISAQWHPRKTSGRLDVQVLIERGRIIEECFAGIGTGLRRRRSCRGERGRAIHAGSALRESPCFRRDNSLEYCCYGNSEGRVSRAPRGGVG
jgi:Family of unknown function (DUF6348)